MVNILKLYVWKDVLCDWTCGVMFALANSVEEARKLIIDTTPYDTEELEREPEIYDSPCGFYVPGGG